MGYNLTSEDVDNIQFLHNRLENYYHESYNVDFLIKAREVISKLEVIVAWNELEEKRR